ncbi:hypothetical protein [Persicobacter diffluens]|uniref:Uncharacterized protein n=1 Tax=Persicobacter diffluens TaxID=981 RepID=A0AAN5AKV3_9BACT|nr:hypothetical protein PEDI_31110 [Persicobacter diffluens]
MPYKDHSEQLPRFFVCTSDEVAQDVEHILCMDSPSCLIEVQPYDEELGIPAVREDHEVIFQTQDDIPYIFKVKHYFHLPLEREEERHAFLKSVADFYFDFLEAEEDDFEDMDEEIENIREELMAEFEEEEKGDDVHDLMLVGRIARPILAGMGAQFEDDEKIANYRETMPVDFHGEFSSYKDIPQVDFYYYKLEFKDQDFEPYLSKNTDARRLSTWDVSEMAIFDKPLPEKVILGPFREEPLFVGFEEQKISLFEKDHFYFTLGNSYLSFDPKKNEVFFTKKVEEAIFFKDMDEALKMGDFLNETTGFDVPPLPFSIYRLWNLPYCGPIKIDGFFTTFVVEGQMLLFHKQNPQFVVLPNYDGDITFSVTVDDIEFLEILPVDHNEIIEAYHEDIITAFKQFIETYGQHL